jgi:hypothetical protein
LSIALDGSHDLLAYAVNKMRPEDLVLRLYVNDWVPTEMDLLANYVEARGSGYEPIPLSGARWAVEEMAQYPAQVFAFSGALGEVFGWYLTRSRSGRLAWAGRFVDGPYVIARGGDRIRVTPRLDLLHFQARSSFGNRLTTEH